MDGDDIALCNELFQRNSTAHFLFQRPSRFDGDKRVIADDIHPQRKRVVCHHSANGAQADDAQRLAFDFRPYKAFFLRFDGFCHTLLAL